MTTRSAPAVDLSKRDLTLDLARVVCVLFVIVVHLVQVGIGPGPDGALVASRPAEEQPWFDAATWVGQIMPLFFVVGGFASAVGWRSWTAKGGDAAGFIRTRTLRLAQPALPLFVFFAVVLGGATLAGVAPQLVADAATGAGSPLWFLAAYLLCQAAVPLLASAHERRPVATVLVLAAAVVVVDAARFSTGVEQLGLLNLLFVWPLVQQFGFWYADGWFDRRHPLALLAIAAAGYALLWPLTAWGPYSTSMLGNLNPPTVPLVVLGVAQACLLRLAKPALTRLMRLRAMQGIVFVLGSRLMTIYLWHLPVMLVLTGVTLLIPGAAPAPASEAWWWSRPLMFLAVLAVLLLLSLAIARWEAIGTLGPVPPGAVVALAWLCAFAPPFAVMEWFLDLPIAVVGAVLLATAVVLLRRRPRTPSSVRSEA
ncbi:acyltransferase [Microbacterium sp. EYE_5]|uniref:acyltransferase family protein n=1 Tax=unclassified Microbacterium TaxID=2609290 RepID=UPI002005496E|nr:MULTISPECIES: acyltransferase [unclassified Microbacterium]MCK6081800.1 acyltransferase [Microbacterium sp. EYE_382]MCK6087070.1 acyltransferase [Microbacterium sp. EYE_384]MCK6124952.1 acyltransferase [Microbacterium sp. EYE_80]MCK6127833.1 acyltransferase [Microbacterium sp. EYE_79]MCK6142754.1 acyltransferase [Microbacterium sp. EYE_39]